MVKKLIEEANQIDATPTFVNIQKSLSTLDSITLDRKASSPFNTRITYTDIKTATMAQKIPPIMPTVFMMIGFKKCSHLLNVRIPTS